MRKKGENVNNRLQINDCNRIRNGTFYFLFSSAKKQLYER